LARMLICTVLGLALVACSDDTTTSKVDGPAIQADGAGKNDGSTIKGSACVATCTVDTDCPTKGTTGFTYKCTTGGVCFQDWCAASSDCKAALFPSCVGNSFANQCMPKACNTTACGSGEECSVVFPGYKGCVPSGTTVSCKVDADCVPPNFSPGQTKCVDGYCGCESDAACQSAKSAAGLDGTWKCMAWSGTWQEL